LPTETLGFNAAVEILGFWKGKEVTRKKARE
jgi:hypothetical protein